jgi:hypothetical protein
MTEEMQFNSWQGQGMKPFSRASTQAQEPTELSFLVGTRVPLLWVQWLEHGADYSPLSNAQFKNAWSYTSTPKACLNMETLHIYLIFSQTALTDQSLLWRQCIFCMVWTKYNIIVYSLGLRGFSLVQIYFVYLFFFTYLLRIKKLTNSLPKICCLLRQFTAPAVHMGEGYYVASDWD